MEKEIKRDEKRNENWTLNNGVLRVATVKIKIRETNANEVTNRPKVTLHGESIQHLRNK